jgi:ParB-like chromosome segregation protein Spo0J
MTNDSKIKELTLQLINELIKVDNINTKIQFMNIIKQKLYDISPLKNQPVDNVFWVPSDQVEGNTYNPNKVAPPEMKLLYTSIKEDGYTQPIVCFYDNEVQKYIVVDGFHRNRIVKEYSDINESTKNYLPIVLINKGINERISATIRHNRARGTHQIPSMADIVAELHFKGWSDKKISEQLGMDKEEIFKFKQFIGLGDLFKDREFSKAWE